ncbi:MAG: hypothetical protein IPL84_01190 [Chitinophagaceae bacterium]|nr:hypothetical protein [Chitinophagaceae bacterium]
MLNRTIKFLFYCLMLLVYGCGEGDTHMTTLETQHIKDSLSEARIDSAYMAIRSNCDTMLVYQVPQMVDSWLKDSALLAHFFDNDQVYHDQDKKVEQVIRQLQADCDSNLLKETYRRARLRQKLKPARHKK